MAPFINRNTFLPHGCLDSLEVEYFFTLIYLRKAGYKSKIGGRENFSHKGNRVKFGVKKRGKMRSSWQPYVELLLPPDTFKYYDWIDMQVKEGPEKYMGLYGFDDEYTILLQEKDIIPEAIKEISKGKKIRAKGYSETSMLDFPIRGRKTKLIYRIRKWQIEGENKIYQNRYEISQSGVKYTKEFSFFFES